MSRSKVTTNRSTNLEPISTKTGVNIQEAFEKISYKVENGRSYNFRRSSILKKVKITLMNSFQVLKHGPKPMSTI
jgi:hypothetical protein